MALYVTATQFRNAHDALQRYAARRPETLLGEAASRLFDEIWTKPEDRNAIIRKVAWLSAELSKNGRIMSGALAAFEIVCWGWTKEQGWYFVKGQGWRRNGNGKP